ncbi:proliferation marker protein Ki-67-like [Epargyreus clarus]|uniref:proliferation marker protein Ki-67-like n=1 Tax=Epargyreus clarus TaxID=520877 RepID=UPI003C2C091E
MSGGRLVVLDRAGRDVKYYQLSEGLATLGSDPACDIRVMLPTVSPHHATVVVHANQTVVRSVSERETQVNGAPVSVAALRHGDVIALGGRALRWEYSDPAAARPLAPQPGFSRARKENGITFFLGLSATGTLYVVAEVEQLHCRPFGTTIENAKVA